MIDVNTARNLELVANLRNPKVVGGQREPTCNDSTDAAARTDRP